MKLRILYILLLFFPVLLFSCSDKKESAASISDDTGKQNKIKMRQLDSLVNRYRGSDPVLAIKYASEAYKTALESDLPLQRLEAYNLLGNAYFGEKPDSAFYFYTKGLSLSDSLNELKIKTRLLYNLSSLYQNAHDYTQTAILLDSSLSLAYRINDLQFVSMLLNSYGSLYDELKDYENSEKMFDSALSVALIDSSYTEMAEAIGNIASMQENDEEYIRLINKAIHYIRKGKGPAESLAAMYVGIGYKMEDPDSAIKYYEKGLSYLGAQNQSFLMLSIYNNLACAYYEKKNNETALRYLREFAVPMARKMNSSDWLSTLYDTYADVLAQMGKTAEAFHYQKDALLERQANEEKSAAAQVRLLTAMLDLKNKETQIKDGKIKLEKSRESRNLILGISVVSFLLLLFSGLILLERKKTQAHQQQLRAARRIIEAEENEKTKIGREFHDIIGQKFVALFNSVDKTEFPVPQEKETMKEVISDLREVVRDLSHKISPKWLEKFTLEEAVSGLCSDCIRLSSVDLQVRIMPSLPQVTDEMKLHVFRIVQELLTNCTKYAGNARAVIDLSAEKSELRLLYSDNGPGFDAEKQKKSGIGISNIFERVNLMKGKAELDSRPGFGTYYKIQLPL